MFMSWRSLGLGICVILGLGVVHVGVMLLRIDRVIVFVIGRCLLLVVIVFFVGALFSVGALCLDSGPMPNTNTTASRGDDRVYGGHSYSSMECCWRILTTRSWI